MKETDTILISIEGNIGSGKSTILNHLKETYPHWTFVDEPVDTWMALKNEKGESLLEIFYKDKRRWSYTFQNVAVLHRFKKLHQALNHPDGEKPRVIVMERSIFTDKMVFTRMLKADGCIDELEWQIYQEWFQHVNHLLPDMDAYIYVNTKPARCMERIIKRHREGESIIPVEYLERLHTYHDDWLAPPQQKHPVFYYDNNMNDTFTLDSIANFIENVAVAKSKHCQADDSIFSRFP